ncbi:MAG: hypothetical protein BGP11_11010 [Rhodobacterales bacterium 65-51]|uniref:hypothetical protein n=1 Tax=uncultured Gemmobacter sp. TaxID=1095917 RepID=UPI000966A089|nr:hypothetical protein [uncultured Gemmobacter sp.]OJY27944.1 MAG: hypothetical protein BGP11_11010 [Rhodobacterales bacterium 65-51]
MQIIIQDQGDRCVIVATSVSSNTLFPLTITAAALRDGLRAILAPPGYQGTGGRSRRPRAHP